MKIFKKFSTLISLLILFPAQSVLGQIVLGDKFGNWGRFEEINDTYTSRHIYIFSHNEKFHLKLMCIGKRHLLTVWIAPGYDGNFSRSKAKMKVDGGGTILIDEFFYNNEGKKALMLFIDEKIIEIIREAKKGHKLFVQARIDPAGVVVEEFSLDGFSEAFTWCNAS